MRYFLIISVLIFFASTSDAHDSLKNLLGKERAEQVVGCFKKSFNDPMVYQKEWCSRNVINLYNQCFVALNPFLINNGLPEGNVLYLLNSDSPVTDIQRQVVYPEKARNGEASWTFHAILEFNGFIFDLDYTGSPKVIDIAEYFKKDFNTTSTSQGQFQYVVRKIKVSDYIQSYSEIYGGKNWQYFIEDPEGLYPLQKLTEYLTNIH